MQSNTIQEVWFEKARRVVGKYAHESISVVCVFECKVALVELTMYWSS